jgi:hypothetical protein
MGFKQCAIQREQEKTVRHSIKPVHLTIFHKTFYRHPPRKFYTLDIYQSPKYKIFESAFPNQWYVEIRGI